MTFRIELIGGLAAICTTLCWIPQAVHIIRDKRTEGISIATQSLFTLGVGIWTGYGLLLRSWPIVLANIVTFALSCTILCLKLRYQSKAGSASSLGGPSRVVTVDRLAQED